MLHNTLYNYVACITGPIAPGLFVDMENPHPHEIPDSDEGARVA